MRKRRVVIYDDEAMILHLMKLFFQDRGYEVFAYSEPRVCPVYEDKSRCRKKAHCSDILITDYRMPGMNGVELLRRQKDMGCMLDISNKAIMTGYMDEAMAGEARQVGCRIFTKPVRLDDLSAWVASCEQRMDLSRELADRRMHERIPSGTEILFSINQGIAAIRGTLVNISSSGFCVKSPVPLSPGQSIRLAEKTLFTSGDAEVRWTDTAARGCLAGLSFC